MTGAALSPSPVPQQALAASIESGIDRIIARKRATVAVLSLAAIAVFLPLPILSSFTTVLDAPVAGVVTWAWLYIVAQFLAGLAGIHLYLAAAAKMDAELRRLRAGPGAGRCAQ